MVSGAFRSTETALTLVRYPEGQTRRAAIRLLSQDGIDLADFTRTRRFGRKIRRAGLECRPWNDDSGGADDGSNQQSFNANRASPRYCGRHWRFSVVCAWPVPWAGQVRRVAGRPHWHRNDGGGQVHARAGLVPTARVCSNLSALMFSQLEPSLPPYPIGWLWQWDRWFPPRPSGSAARCSYVLDVGT